MKRVRFTIEILIPDYDDPALALENYIANILESGESFIDYGELEVEDIES